MGKYLFTSESVTEGHPDKVCDQISDAILDAIFEQDNMAHVACETTAVAGIVNIMGEISTTAKVDYEAVTRNVINEIGYDRDELLFNGHNCKINNMITTQSPDIAMGVNESYELKDGEEDKYNQFGAGDQGMMFGYACDETEELMPLTISLSHKLAKKLTEVRKNGTLKYLRPDGKTQVTALYEDGKVVSIDTVVISTQHDEDVTLEQIRNDLIKYVIKPIIPENLLTDDTRILVNPTGRFVIGGPAGDSGLTGRKIIVDTYGGYGIASRCEVQLAYAIGVAKPVSIMVDTFGTSKYSNSEIANAVKKVFDCRPAAIIEELNLRNTKFLPTAAYGHMGRTDLNVKWEDTDKVEELKKALA